MTQPVLIVIRRGEDPRKCSVRPLRGTPGIEFLPYPLRQVRDFSNHLLLTPGAPPLTPADLGRPLLLLDASWRHADRMKRAIGAVEPRSIPPNWLTAYPRQSKTHADPGTGLATVEALYAALTTLGIRDDSLLRHYPWRDAFLQLNHALLLPLPPAP